MIDQTPDPWTLMVQKWRGDAGVLRAAANPISASDMEAAKMEEGAATLLYCAEQVDRALAAERAQHQQEIAKRDETIRQLQDAFARCQEVQQATAETWRIEHDQMAEQIRLLRGAMAADDERLRRAAEQAGILYVSCDTAEALAEQITRLSAQVAELEAERAAEREAELADPVAQRADRYAAEASDLTLRLIAAEAERDAAQQQIATLTEAQAALRDELATKILCVPFRGADVKPTGAYLLLDDVLRVMDRSDLRAALQYAPTGAAMKESKKAVQHPSTWKLFQRAALLASLRRCLPASHQQEGHQP